MKFIKLEPKHYDAWNDFCHKDTWFWHMSDWQIYIQNAKSGVEYKNHSFFIQHNNETVGIVPLIQENNEFTFQGGPGPSYVCQPKHEKYVLQEIHRLAEENGVKRIAIQGNVKGYLDMSTYTCVLNLDEIKPTKGHKAIINKAKKHLTLEALTETEQFMLDYFKIAGKRTRPEKTFKILQNWITHGHGTLLRALYQNETAGYVYVLHYKDRAYYFASCTFDKHKSCGTNHFLLWNTFELLKNKGVKYFELGEQFYNSLHYQPTQKENNISKFKRFFGGQIIHVPASEYFFDADYMRHVYEERLKNYLRSEFDE